MKRIIQLSIILSVLLSSNLILAQGKSMNTNNNYETAVLGAGCFWCVEAIFQQLKGVVDVESGYSNGVGENPTYKQVCSGLTGYAEVAKITFDPKEVSFEEVLTVFWHTHNPTTLNRQGADKGTQYRSAIFYQNEEQKSIAEKSKQETEESKLWEDTIVTEISPLENYYKAEAYHQNYYNNNSSQPYCSVVIAPKIQKFHKEFAHLLKK